MIGQRLIVLFDGTWNDSEDRTNVYRLARQIQDYDGEKRQRFFYDPGVGTSKWSRFRGGAFGYGLSENLIQGYEWLSRNYREEDEIWIFGFSRGAYTARSLVGLIRKCGLLHITSPTLLEKAESIYRDKLHPDSPIYEDFRKAYSRNVKIHFIGVWDTVGALGIPGTTLLSERGKYSWHDTELSGIVERAYHALALDEFRAAYDVSLWAQPGGQKKTSQIEVEQRWFIGAHADVGGGYEDKALSEISLNWMQTRATDAGLKMDLIEPTEEAWNTDPKPSFHDFLFGWYAKYRKILSKGDGKFYRKFATGPKGHPAVNVTVDESVWQRWRASDGGYRPRTLTDAEQQPPAT